MKTKLLSLLLAVIMLASLAACTNNPDADPAQTTVAPAVNNPESETIDDRYDANGYLKDNIPATLSFNNDKVNFLTWDEVENPEFFAEDLNGEVINDAIFERNRIVEEKLGVDLEYTSVKGRSMSTYSNLIKTSIQASDHSFDIMAGYSQTIAGCSYLGLLFNLLDTEYLDFTMPWWPKTLVDETTVDGKVYFCSGDISTNTLHMMQITFFNKKLIDDFKLENPYDLVANNQWVLDKEFEMCAGIYSDLDGNNKKNIGDRFGVTISNLGVDAYLYGSGIRTTEKTEDGYLLLSPSYFSDKAQNLLEKLCNMCYVSEDGFYGNSNTFFERNGFNAGNVLFYADRANAGLLVFKDSADLEYGIVPCPKWDASQENYVTCMGNPFTNYALPSDCRDTDLGSAVLEALASAAYRTTTPAIFEISMKIKYSQDEVSSQMYDIARETLTFDYGRMLGTSLDDLTQTLYRTRVANNTQIWAGSAGAAYTKVLTGKLNTVNESFKTMS